MRGLRGPVPWLVLACAAVPALAYFPTSSTIANAVAKENRSAGRVVPLQLEVDLLMGDTDAVVATGSLLSDPSGVARIELRSPRGNVERHLLRGAGLEATRQGERLERPRPFLPPFFLLQADTAGALSSQLVELGARVGSVELGYDGRLDCFVVGGRGRVGQPVPERASLWIDQESLEVVRVDLANGARFRFGPPKAFGKLRVPGWVEIHSGQLRVGRLSVRNAARVRPAPGSFALAWLAEAPSPR